MNIINMTCLIEWFYGLQFSVHCSALSYILSRNQKNNVKQYQHKLKTDRKLEILTTSINLHNTTMTVTSYTVSVIGLSNFTSRGRNVRKRHAIGFCIFYLCFFPARFKRWWPRHQSSVVLDTWRPSQLITTAHSLILRIIIHSWQCWRCCHHDTVIVRVYLMNVQQC